jgi:hypothetical protein
MQIITGNKFKLISDFVLDQNGLRKTEINNSIPIFFVKTDYINIFFDRYLPDYHFKIITHNSDYPIDNRYSKFFENQNLVCWYGQNINYLHSKLKSIPIGIANEIWEHGNEDILNEVISNNNQKSNLIYCNFDINTNLLERQKCVRSMEKNKLTMNNKTNFKNYLEELSKSYFSLSPNGNGIDCHKTWESLYLKTIPVVTKSINSEFYSNLPIYFIESWDDFNVERLTINLYENIIKKFTLSEIDVNFYYKKILENGRN